MSDIRIAYRYAKSLMDLAIEKNILEQVQKDMHLFKTVCEQNRDFKMMLSNPIVLHSQKLTVMEKIFEGKVNEMVMAFFRIITKKGRESYLLQVAISFQNQYNEYMNIDHAIVTTNMELSAELRKEVIAMVNSITNRKVDLEEKVNKDLIGGFVLRVGDKQIDESINSKIRDLRQKMTSNKFIKLI